MTQSKTEASASEKKRMESIMNRKKNYQQQKLTIRAALSKIDLKPTNQQFSTTNNQGGTKNNKKQSLFEDDEQSDEERFNFEMKSQFEGEQGSKLMALQSRYKNDQRFKLDQRFIEEQEDENEAVTQPSDPASLEEEKQKEFEILNEVLGQTIKPKLNNRESNIPKKMLRFDPAAPEHTQYELKRESSETKTKKKKRPTEVENQDIIEPEVSQEVFYKVGNDLKESLQQSKGFSLLESFGKNEDVDDVEQEVQKAKDLPKVKNGFEPNPFHYDSSEDEMETENETKPAQTPMKELKTSINEPFFFQKNDKRLLEGLEFVKKIAGEDNPEFTQLRRDLKQISRNKTRNVQRKNRPFKKKLGGSNIKKKLRFKRALKR